MKKFIKKWIGFILFAICLLIAGYFGDRFYIITYFIGSIVGLAELKSRYKHGILEIFSHSASWIYLLINGCASAFVLWFIDEYKISLGDFMNKEAGKIILSGTSSMILLRSSIANIKVGSKNISAGIAEITQVFLDAADRAFDQAASSDNLPKLKLIMADIDFKKAKKELPSLCFASMQNVSKNESKKILNLIESLSRNSLDNNTKVLELGMFLSRCTGMDLLETSVETLGDIIKLSDLVNATADNDVEKIRKLKEFFV